MEAKYEYGYFSWGGFYNEHNIDIHQWYESNKPKYFSTKAMRDSEITAMKAAQKECKKVLKEEGRVDDCTLIIQTFEGFDIRELPCLHRVVEYEGKQYYTSYQWTWPERDIQAIKYHMTYKWCVGCNDYPLGGKHDYEKNPVKVLQEWITGSFENDY